MAAEQSFKVKIASPERMIFEGNASSLMLPGERGMFSIMPFSKPILSRLVRGIIDMDGNELKIKRGIVQSGFNDVTVIVEEEA